MPWRRDRLPTLVFLDFPCGSAGKESACNVEDLGSIPGLRLPMKEMQETQVQSLGQEDPLEEKMATHFSFLAWKIPWTEEPGRLQSMGSLRVRHDSDFTFTFHFHQSVFGPG